MSMIELIDVWKIYKKKEVQIEALKGINLKVETGEYISIMGPSGSGKTTLLNIIGTIDFPTRGKYIFEGVDVSRMSDEELSRFRRKNVGFVFQSYNLISDLTAWENVALPLYYDGVKDKRVQRKKAMEMLEKVGLLDRADHLPGELSGGEEQRVAIARALINNPRIILADEPTGNLDSKTSEEIMELFGTLHANEKITFIVVTHEKVIAEKADKVLYLLDGKITSLF